MSDLFKKLLAQEWPTFAHAANYLVMLALGALAAYLGVTP